MFDASCSNTLNKLAHAAMASCRASCRHRSSPQQSFAMQRPTKPEKKKMVALSVLRIPERAPARKTHSRTVTDYTLLITSGGLGQGVKLLNLGSVASLTTRRRFARARATLALRTRKFLRFLHSVLAGSTGAADRPLLRLGLRRRGASGRRSTASR